MFIVKMQSVYIYIYAREVKVPLVYVEETQYHVCVYRGM